MADPLVTVRLAGEPQGKGRPRLSKRKASDEQITAAYGETGNVWTAAEKLGMCGQSVHERLAKLGAVKVKNVFTEADRERLMVDYEAYASSGRLAELAEQMGRTKHFLARQAGLLNLTKAKRSKPWAAGEAAGDRVKAAWAKHGHPRGMTGKTIAAADDLTEAERIAKPWANTSVETRAARSLKAMKTKVNLYGSVAPAVSRGNWKAAWREIGGKRKFFRSRWEANYARYLEWLKQRGVITEWQHEPETFWFEAIRRGVRSYLPDFRIWFPNGKTELHEVKGWMDSRSKTTIRRMAKYHPQETLIVIDRPQYASITKQVSAMIEGWE